MAANCYYVTYYIGKTKVERQPFTESLAGVAFSGIFDTVGMQNVVSIEDESGNHLF